MSTTNSDHSHFWQSLTRTARNVLTLFAVLTLSCLMLPNPSDAAMPTPVDCQNDVDGANDVNNPNDITRACIDEGDGAPFDLHISANWDGTTLNGANTEDICTLYDTNVNALVDLAICVVVESGLANIATFKEFRLYTCGDTKGDRCTTPTEIFGPFITTCEAKVKENDPFGPMDPNGPGTDHPFDTETLCWIALDDFDAAGANAVFLDACIYPSQQPNSNPFDCILFSECNDDGECDDGNTCTIDTCNTNLGICVHTADVDATCTGLFCDGDDICNNLGLCENVGPRNCDDPHLCTIDTCDELNNVCLNVPMNTLCTDNVFCNGMEICDASTGCESGTAPDCDDNNECTVDACDVDIDMCTKIPDDGACDNGLFCDGDETCDILLGCQSGTAPDCDDSDVCTTDACDEDIDMCTNIADDGDCDDNLFCNGVETCDSLLGCQAGTAPDCDIDGVVCTDDSCNEETDTCNHTPNNANCDNGLFCDGPEICTAGGCQAGTAPDCDIDGVVCTDDSCNEETDTCNHTPNNANCDNGLFCDGDETCDSVLGCQSGTAPNCDDSVGCTDDACDEDINMCTNTPDNASCNNGDFCDGEETCTTLGCQDGPAPVCDDSIACTVDTCDEGINMCTNTSDNDLCTDGLFCTGVEICDGNVCLEGSDPCPGAETFCIEATDQCVGCLFDADCDNDVFCDGAEICSAGTCVDGTPPDCDDNVSCTVDSCDEIGNQCQNVAQDGLCDNGLFCDGIETCDASSDCEDGTPPNCDDGVPCTVDNCDEGADMCTNTTNDANCDNGLFCDGEETCDASSDCLPGMPPDCNDGVACTDDACNEAGGTCTNTTNNANCSNGQFCDGVEICTTGGCQAGSGSNCNDGISCTVDSCDEFGNQCLNVAVDNLCDNGLFCDGVETCTTGGCQSGTAPDCNDGISCTSDSL